jgi:SAM-dependent methyltransferase
MDDPTRLTRGTYDVIAARYLEKARDLAALGPYLDAFAHALAPGSRVVDLGAGPGIDTALLRARALRAVGLDLSLGMLRAGVGECPGSRVLGDARRLPIATGGVDGVWANASLLHLTRVDAMRALGEVRRIVRPGGVLFITMKAGSGSVIETAPYGLPRFFQYWADTEFDAALAAHAFDVLSRATDILPRGRWLSRLARRA